MRIRCAHVHVCIKIYAWGGGILTGSLELKCRLSAWGYHVWDNDNAQLKALLKQHLLSNFPLPLDADTDSAFNVLFTFGNFLSVMPDLNAIGSVVVSRSRSIKQKSAAIKGTSSSSDLKLDATALETPAATSPMNSCCSYTRRHSWQTSIATNTTCQPQFVQTCGRCYPSFSNAITRT